MSKKKADNNQVYLNVVKQILGNDSLTYDTLFNAADCKPLFSLIANLFPEIPKKDKFYARRKSLSEANDIIHKIESNNKKPYSNFDLTNPIQQMNFMRVFTMNEVALRSRTQDQIKNDVKNLLGTNDVANFTTSFEGGSFLAVLSSLLNGKTIDPPQPAESFAIIQSELSNAGVPLIITETTLQKPVEAATILLQLHYILEACKDKSITIPDKIPEQSKPKTSPSEEKPKEVKKVEPVKEEKPITKPKEPVIEKQNPPANDNNQVISKAPVEKDEDKQQQPGRKRNSLLDRLSVFQQNIQQKQEKDNEKVEQARKMFDRDLKTFNETKDFINERIQHFHQIPAPLHSKDSLKDVKNQFLEYDHKKIYEIPLTRIQKLLPKFKNASETIPNIQPSYQEIANQTKELESALNELDTFVQNKQKEITDLYNNYKTYEQKYYSSNNLHDLIKLRDELPYDFSEASSLPHETLEYRIYEQIQKYEKKRDELIEENHQIFNEMEAIKNEYENKMQDSTILYSDAVVLCNDCFTNITKLYEKHLYLADSLKDYDITESYDKYDPFHLLNKFIDHIDDVSSYYQSQYDEIVNTIPITVDLPSLSVSESISDKINALIHGLSFFIDMIKSNGATVNIEELNNLLDKYQERKEFIDNSGKFICNACDMIWDKFAMPKDDFIQHYDEKIQKGNQSVYIQNEFSCDNEKSVETFAFCDFAKKFIINMQEDEINYDEISNKFAEESKADLEQPQQKDEPGSVSSSSESEKSNDEDKSDD